jgi:AIPR protein
VDVASLNLTYPAILEHFGKHKVSGRTESRSFLGWFLENYFRLDQLHVEDSICDGTDDKGVDGIYVDSTLEVVYVFQAKLMQKDSRTLGDSALREFAGTLRQFDSPQNVKALADSTGNVELKNLILDEDMTAKIETGYEVRGVFLTNAALDRNGKLYLAANSQITVYDRNRLKNEWLPMGNTEPVEKEIAFHLDGLGHIEYKTENASVFVVSLRATELVQMAGIESQALFEWNVRQSLGRTNVNRAIAESVASPAEHKNFMLYHNGLTVLAIDVALDEDADELRIDRYSVVNGAQSLSTLYDKRSGVSEDLRLLARVIRLHPATDLAAMITRNSNNQNAIGARDLQSNSVIQKRLKEEFARSFGKQFSYEIKRGEQTYGERVITNEDAAKVLLAFDVEQPWACHQSYRLFDDLHSNIFGRPVVTAERIVGLIAVRDAVEASLKNLDNQIAAYYSLTSYFVMYLVKQALQLDPLGKEFCQDPGRFVRDRGFDAVVKIVGQISDDLIVDLNAELAERGEAGKPFDHKRELKSANAVRTLRSEVLPSYQKAVSRKRASSFTEEWETPGK